MTFKGGFYTLQNLSARAVLRDECMLYEALHSTEVLFVIALCRCSPFSTTLRFAKQLWSADSGDRRARMKIFGRS